MLNLILKIFLSPKNIIGIIIECLTIMSLCLVFVELKEKWWKELIPIYNTYLLYKNTWKHKCFFVLELSFLFLSYKSKSLLKREFIGNLFEIIFIIFNKQPIDVSVNIHLIIFCIFGVFVFEFSLFVMKRISYLKVAKKLNYNIFQKICAIITPISFCVFIFLTKIKKRR